MAGIGEIQSGLFKPTQHVGQPILLGLAAFQRSLMLGLIGDTLNPETPNGPHHLPMGAPTVDDRNPASTSMYYITTCLSILLYTPPSQHGT